MDFSSQKFCNETSLGQNSPWTKHPRQFCAKTSPFSGTDCPSLKIKQYFSTKRLWPTKNAHFDFSHIFYCTRSVVPVYITLITFFVQLRLPGCCLGGPNPAARFCKLFIVRSIWKDNFTVQVLGSERSREVISFIPFLRLYAHKLSTLDFSELRKYIYLSVYSIRFVLCLSIFPSPWLSCL
jgi:hypothetical protein